MSGCLVVAGRPLGAVFTYKWKGEQLAALVDNGTKVLAEVTVAHHCSVRTSINRLVEMWVLRLSSAWASGGIRLALHADSGSTLIMLHRYRRCQYEIIHTSHLHGLG